jgi:hypothetical protein
MGHHLTSDVDRDWIYELTNCFLIREPRDMITSYIKIVPEPSPHDLALPQQVELFETIRRENGKPPPVIDAREALADPERILTLLCRELDLDFTRAMLAWDPGLRSTDGVWAPHWYDSVAKTTGFGTYPEKDDEVPASLRDVLDECEEYYQLLYRHRLR